MKKGLMLVVLFGLVVAILGTAGFAYAQSQTPPTPGSGAGYGYGMMGGRGGMMGGRGGMMGFNGTMPMHDFMEEAFAQELGMTEEELEAELASGKTMWQVAQEKGKTDEEIYTLMADARTQALQAMVAAGTITQEQADSMNERMQNRQGANGAGGCPGMGGGRWNSTQTY